MENHNFEARFHQHLNFNTIYYQVFFSMDLPYWKKELNLVVPLILKNVLFDWQIQKLNYSMGLFFYPY